MFLVLDIGSRGFFDRGDIVDYRIGQSDKEKEEIESKATMRKWSLFLTLDCNQGRNE